MMIIRLKNAALSTRHFNLYVLSDDAYHQLVSKLPETNVYLGQGEAGIPRDIRDRVGKVSAIDNDEIIIELESENFEYEEIIKQLTTHLDIRCDVDGLDITRIDDIFSVNITPEI